MAYQMIMSFATFLSIGFLAQQEVTGNLHPMGFLLLSHVVFIIGYFSVYYLDPKTQQSLIERPPRFEDQSFVR